jgi:asparagine synthase (glutamine-hydrolysing)
MLAKQALPAAMPMNSLIGRFAISPNRLSRSGIASAVPAADVPTAAVPTASNARLHKLAFNTGAISLAADLQSVAANWFNDARRSLLIVGLAPAAAKSLGDDALPDLCDRLEEAPTDALRSVQGGWMLFFANHERQTGLLAASCAGVRAPCFAALPDQVVFGLSALDVARADPRLGAIDDQAIFDYLQWHFIPAPGTIFAGVQRLRPGELVRFGAVPETREYYWQPRYGEHRSPFSLDASRHAFRELLDEAVLGEVDDGTMGAFLSGGTDSSTVAGILGRISGKPARTYSIGFDVEGFDEMEYARIAAAHFGTVHHEHYVTPADIVVSIPLVAAAYDQPFGNSSALPAFHCARLARQDGVTRILGGDGGDELFGGNTRYAKQKIFEAYRHVPRPARKAIESTLLRTAIADRIPLVRKVRSYVAQARIPIPARLHSYSLVSRIGETTIFEPAFLAAIDVGEAEREELEWYGRCPAGAVVDRMLQLDWKYTLADNDLPKVVGTCDLAGIGVGFPMLNEKLVQFANALPAAQKVRRLRLRPFFKDALSDFLPQAIIAKKKHGFGLPFGPWLVQHEPLRALVTASLQSFASRGIVRPAFIRELLEARMRDHAIYYGELVYVILMLEQWLAAHCPSYRFAAR